MAPQVISTGCFRRTFLADNHGCLLVPIGTNYLCFALLLLPSPSEHCLSRTRMATVYSVSVSKRDLRTKPNESHTILESVLRLIKAHTRNEHGKPLIAHIPDHIGRSAAVQEALRGIPHEFENGVLYVTAIPSDLHVTCTTWFNRTYIQYVLPLLSPSN